MTQDQGEPGSKDPQDGAAKKDGTTETSKGQTIAEAALRLAEGRWNFLMRAWVWVFGPPQELAKPPSQFLCCVSAMSGGVFSFIIVFLLAPKGFAGWTVTPFLDAARVDPALWLLLMYFVVAGFFIGRQATRGDSWHIFVQGFVGPWLLGLFLTIVVTVLGAILSAMVGLVNFVFG